jgi:hypothetical protein
LTVNGFNPAGDEEIYVLEALTNGAQPTSAQLLQLTADLQAIALPANAIVTPFATLPATIQGLFHNPYDLAVIFPSGNSTSTATTPDVLAYDFSGYTSVPNVTITGIGVVPEPGSVAVLLLGGIGLMGRRRNRSSAY